MKIVTVVGARPQFVKASALSRAIVDEPSVEEVLIHTGQHYDYAMSQSFFETLKIPAPKYSLEVGSGSHGVQTGAMLAKLDPILEKEKPDWMLVYGDTNSTLAGALCASKMHIPVAHVEAGLRSFNRRMPEELNRIVTDHLSTVLFTPTRGATEQLLREGIGKEKVFEVGDVMLDVSRSVPLERGRIEKYIRDTEGHYLVVTIHRAENTDDRKNLEWILESLLELSKEVPLIFPVHPRTRKAFESLGSFPSDSKRLHFIDPIDFIEMSTLLHYSNGVVTDSGGLQKEAFFHGKPCITLRTETEWTELVDAGWNVLCPPIEGDIQASYRKSTSQHRKDVGPYGDGTAAAQILRVLRRM